MAEPNRVFFPIRFGNFEVDVQTGELRKQGYRVKLQEQPFQLLLMLLEHPGEVVTREELQKKLWAADTFVDFERGLNRAVNKLREALADNADSPRFIETLPRRGYRFIAPAMKAGSERRETGSLFLASPKKAVSNSVIIGNLLDRNRGLAVSAITAAVVAIGVLGFVFHRPASTPAELLERRLTFNSIAKDILSATISADGKYLAYSDRTGIYVRLLSTGEERLIQPPTRFPAGDFLYVDSWFPNGTELLAHSTGAGGRGNVWAASVMGQSSRSLRDDALGWGVSPDGTRVAFSPTRTGKNSPEIWIMNSQGDNPQRVLSLPADELLRSVRWSPDGHRLTYLRTRHSSQLLETCDLKGSNRTTVLFVPGRARWVRGLCWLPGGRIIYSQAEAADVSANFWQIKIDTYTGVPAGQPKRITHWDGFNLQDLSASSDGKRLVLQKATYPNQVYIAELAPGRRMSPPRRLTNDEAHDWATAWTADSKAVLFSSDRGGKGGLFKQRIDQELAEPLVQGRENVDLPRLSPDGAWVLYSESSMSPGAHSPRYRLMRVPVNGGVPKIVFETTGVRWDDVECSRAPSSLCVIIEPGRQQMTVSALDPVKGKRKLLRIIKTNINEGFCHALSPDGSMFAIVRGDENDIHIRLLSLIGGSDREIAVKSWPNIQSMDWSADGKGLYCGSISSQSGTLLYVDLKGNAQVVLRSTEVDGGTFIGGVPSPNGRYLALTGAIRNSNVWMLEGF